MAIAIAQAKVRLLDVDPDLGRFLSQDDLSEARGLAVPVLHVGSEDEALAARLRAHRAFAALLIDGMVLEQLQVGDQVGLRVLSPGDLVTFTGEAPSVIVAQSSTRALPGSHLALLGAEFLLATRRWPALVRGLHLRSTHQAERLATQLVVCQLPRVDQRLLALMWLLAEDWGRVTSAGTTLPLRLTHDMLGAMVGARRPSVTLALRDLAERGAVVRQDQGWLLLEAPPGVTRAPDGLGSPRVIEDRAGTRVTGPTVRDESQDDGLDLTLLSQRLAGLRARYAAEREVFEERLRSFSATRERCRARRLRANNDRLRRGPARSS